jgi:hypothetical protein
MGLAVPPVGQEKGQGDPESEPHSHEEKEPGGPGQAKDHDAGS